MAQRFASHYLPESAAVMKAADMTCVQPDHISDIDTLPRMAARVTSARAETLEDVAFLSGAALSHLHLV